MKRVIDVEGFPALDLVFTDGVYAGRSYSVVVKVSVGYQVISLVVYLCFDEGDGQFSVCQPFYGEVEVQFVCFSGFFDVDGVGLWDYGDNFYR